MTEKARTRYIIIGMQRSGTTITHSCMYGHPNICAMVDEFRVEPFFTDGVSAFTVSGNNPWERKKGYLQLFDAVTIYRASPQSGYFPYGGNREQPKGELVANGMKIAVNNTRSAGRLVQSLVDYFPDVKVVYVQRHDWLAQYASLLRATKSGKWHSWTKVDRELSAEELRVEIDLHKFDHYIRQAIGIGETLDNLRQTHEVCDIDYDLDIIGGHREAAQRLFSLVGAPWMEPVWVHSQKVSPPVDDFVLNCDEMRAHLDARRSLPVDQWPPVPEPGSE